MRDKTRVLSYEKESDGFTGSLTFKNEVLESATMDTINHSIEFENLSEIIEMEVSIKKLILKYKSEIDHG